MEFDVMSLFSKSPALALVAIGLLMMLAGGGLAGSAKWSVSQGASWDDPVNTSGPQVTRSTGPRHGTPSQRRSQRRRNREVMASTNQDHWNYGMGAIGFGVLLLVGAGGVTVAMQQMAEEE